MIVLQITEVIFQPGLAMVHVTDSEHHDGIRCDTVSVVRAKNCKKDNSNNKDRIMNDNNGNLGGDNGCNCPHLLKPPVQMIVRLTNHTKFHQQEQQP